MRRLAPLWIVAAALVVYLLLGLAWISLPGPEHDEVLFLNASFPHGPVTWYIAKVRIFGHDVPTMLMPYVGALKGLLWRGVFLLWKPSVYSVRVPAVLLGGAALLLFYFWARQFYSRGTALAALGLAATDPTYIYSARVDWGPVVLAHLFCFAGLLLGALWLRKDHGNWVHLAGAGFCFGLGLWDKATFAWFLLALAATLAVLFPREMRPRLRPSYMAVLLLSFLMGAFPLVRYNLTARQSGTAQAVRLERPERTVIEGKVFHLHITLDGRFVYFLMGGWIMDQGVSFSVSDRPQLALDGLARLGPSSGTLLPWAAAAALLIGLAARGARRAILFPSLLALFVWLQMIPIKDAGSAHHLALLYPFPHLAVAAAGSWLWSRAGFRGRPVLAFALAVLLLTQIGWAARYLQVFRLTGGLGNWTDAIYQIAHYLDAAKPDVVVNMDWGFTYPLLLLSSTRQMDFYGEVSFQKPADELPYIRQLISLLERPGTLFLFHTEGYENFSVARMLFERALELSGKRARVVRTFYQRTGEPVAYLAAAETGPPQPREVWGAPAELSFSPAEVSPGEQYKITCPDLAGKFIDLKYVFKGRAPAVAGRFCLLDRSGKALIRVPVPFESGVVEVLAVRVTGTLEWRPANAKLIVK